MSEFESREALETALANDDLDAVRAVAGAGFEESAIHSGDVTDGELQSADLIPEPPSPPEVRERDERKIELLEQIAENTSGDSA